MFVMNSKFIGEVSFFVVFFGTLIAIYYWNEIKNIKKLGKEVTKEMKIKIFLTHLTQVIIGYFVYQLIKFVFVKLI
ncbi:MAG: hypothetical protein ACRCXZ_02105 [Patescibacteria group bacterium]